MSYVQTIAIAFEASKHKNTSEWESQNNPTVKSTRLKSTATISSPLDN
jgi:hypothetical protein